MSWIKFKNFTFLILTSIHLIIVVLSYLKEPGSKAVMLASFIIVLLLIPIIVNIFLGKMKVLAVNTSLILFFLLFIEGLFSFRIIQHPVISTWTLTVSKNIGAVDFLEEAPFVKFKPQTKVKSQGSRGSDFTYEWQTDALGFKNINHADISNLHFDYIALGDSFTEGMGVAIEDTWISKVGQKSNLTIYNASVQGYSASQMKATYDKLKGKISHEGIIIGVLPTIFEREQTFSIYETASFGTGGIRTIAGAGSAGQNSFLTGLIRAIKRTLKYMIIPIIDQNVTSKNYRNEVPVSYPDRASLEQDVNWNKYVQNLIELSNLALQSNKKVILIQYPHRHEIYFNEQELGINELKEIDYYVELEILKEVLPKNVKVFDMFPYIKETWSANQRNIYFIIDGHMNERGHELISEFIVNNVDKP